MKPRVFFVLRTAFVLLAAALVLLSAVLIGSAIIVAAQRDGWLILFSFGPKGWYQFLLSLPWLVVGLVGILLIIMEVLGWYGTRAYRKPILFSSFILVVVVIIASTVLAQTPFHEYMIVHRVPMFRPLYNELEAHVPHHAFFGELSSTTSDHWVIALPDGESVVVTITADTMFPAGMDFNLSDTLVVFGDRDDATVTARGVRKVTGNDIPRTVRFMRRPPLPLR